ncbi:hypothetical protein M3610_13520 [Neobacillus sp. MER 74]|uniref:hypothetical protein n=1 Tax=Neobacillus sp. MER 74 TaxID=2939566 RepID=UPI00203E2357|nr:hypothetical protein [Neobacillus sp. MER 74]MCM3116319.1 hypothetical protein [Neobacillus sp. MER 74]
MFGIELLKDFMKEQFGVAIDTVRLAEESVQLYLEELDKEIVPPTVHDYLPDLVVFQTYSYFDDSEWIIGIVLEAETNNPLFLVCLKDGRRIYQQLL